MIEWFKTLNIEIQVAIVTAIGGIIAAVVKGLISLTSKKKEQTIPQENYGIVNQSSLGDYNTVIGTQCNHGLTANDAVDIAFSIFEKYYPQLKEEALFEVRNIVEDNLKNIPNKEIIAPSPRIVVPTLQNASITEEADVRLMYANLLSSSMNSTSKDYVHPSYVEIIRQLNSDEAKIISHMKNHKIILAITIRILIKGRDCGKCIDFFTDIPEKVGCKNVDNPERLFENLIRLGLVSKHNSGLSFLEDECNKLRNHPIVKKARMDADASVSKINGFDGVVERFGYYMLTGFGEDFCAVCV